MHIAKDTRLDGHGISVVVTSIRNHTLRKQLEQLARMKEPEARSRLIRALVAEYARSDGQEPSDTERDLFSMIVLSVFDQLDRSARYELVVRLAKTDRISTALADRLAREDYELSEPVIECSPMISQDTLRAISKAGSTRQKMSVTHRPDLSEEITDTLIARSPRPIVHSLLSNLKAPISVKANLALLIFANTEADILGGMAQRALLDPEFLETQMDILEAGCPLIPKAFENALRKGELDRLAKDIGTRGEGMDITIDGVTYSRHEASVQIASGELSFDAILLTLCKERRFDAAAWLIGRKIRMEHSVVLETLKSDSDIALMMLLLEAEVSEATYKDMMRERCAWQDRNARIIPDLVQRYKSENRRRKAATERALQQKQQAAQAAPPMQDATVQVLLPLDIALA